MQTWFALRSQPQKEFAVEQILRRRGVSVFVPTEVKWTRTARHKREPRRYPLLPRYLFASGVDPYALVWAMQGRGITGVVAFGGEPAQIRQDAIDQLARISGGMVPTRQTIHRGFIPGDRVQIIKGAFKDWLVPIESINGETAKVLLTMFGGVKEVTVPLSALEAA